MNPGHHTGMLISKAHRSKWGPGGKSPLGGVRNIPTRKKAIPATKILFLHVCMWGGGMPSCFPEALLTAEGTHNRCSLHH